MIREFAEALKSFCQDTMMMLGLDDLQRADPSSLDLLNYLGSVTFPAKLLLIATVGGETGAQRVRSLISPLKARGRCDEIELSGLTRQNVAEFLVIDMLPQIWAVALSSPLHKLSGGVPLFLISAVHYVEAQGWILKTESGWILSAEAVHLEEFVPPNLNELIGLRIDRLTEQEQQILEAASIVGIDFAADLVAHALNADSHEVGEICNRLVRQGGWVLLKAIWART